MWDADNGESIDRGPFRQVSRLGNPLVNEVLIPLGQQGPLEHAAAVGRQAVRQLRHASPALAALLPALYPGVFPNLATLVASGKPRADLEAILLTGIPAGHHPRLPELHRAGARPTCSG